MSGNMQIAPKRVSIRNRNVATGTLRGIVFKVYLQPNGNGTWATASNVCLLDERGVEAGHKMVSGLDEIAPAMKYLLRHHELTIDEAVVRPKKIHRGYNTGKPLHQPID